MNLMNLSIVDPLSDLGLIADEMTGKHSAEGAHLGIEAPAALRSRTSGIGEQDDPAAIHQYLRIRKERAQGRCQLLLPDGDDRGAPQRASRSSGHLPAAYNDQTPLQRGIVTQCIPRRQPFGQATWAQIGIGDPQEVCFGTLRRRGIRRR